MWREVPSLVTSLETFHGWRGNLVQLFKETLFVAMQTKAASQHRGPAATYKIIVSNKKSPSFRPPGFSPYMGREEGRVQGLDYVHVGLFQRSTYIVFGITSRSL